MKIKKILYTVFKEDTDNTFFQLIRYTFIGGVAFLIDYGTLALLTECFKVHYMISAIFGFTFGLAVNYILSITWVFRQRALNNKLLELLVFVIIGIVGLGLNELFIWIFTNKVEIHYLISKIFTAVIVYLWNFFARKYILFYKHK